MLLERLRTHVRQASSYGKRHVFMWFAELWVTFHWITIKTSRRPIPYENTRRLGVCKLPTMLVWAHGSAFLPVLIHEEPKNLTFAVFFINYENSNYTFFLLNLDSKRNLCAVIFAEFDILGDPRAFCTGYDPAAIWNIDLWRYTKNKIIKPCLPFQLCKSS